MRTSRNWGEREWVTRTSAAGIRRKIEFMTQIKIRKTERERAKSLLDAKGACLMSEPISTFLRFFLAPLIVCELYDCSGVFASVFAERNWAHAGKKPRSKEESLAVCYASVPEHSLCIGGGRRTMPHSDFSHPRFGLCYFGLCSKSTSITDGTWKWMWESTEMVLYCKLMQDRIVALTARFTTALSRVELM